MTNAIYKFVPHKLSLSSEWTKWAVIVNLTSINKTQNCQNSNPASLY